MTMMHQRHLRVRPRRAFTLIEVTVTIAIIMVLAGLIVAAGVGVLRRQAVSSTENALAVLEAAYTEWKNLSGRDLTFGVVNEPNTNARYDVLDPNTYSEAEALFITQQVMAVLGRNPQVRDLLIQLNDERIKAVTVTINGQPTESYNLFDAWDNPIFFVFPGRAFVPGFDAPPGPDEDRTVRTIWEQRFGIAQRGRGYFISAGPSGSFGDPTFAPGTSARREFEDNLYSNPVIKP